MSNGAFWTNHQTDPKRKYRFQVQLAAGAAQGSALSTPIWFAKTVDKPEVTVNTGEVNYMSHKFYFPGTVEWNEVNLVLVDPISPDAAAATLTMLEEMGYLGPNAAAPGNSNRTLSKQSAFEVIITQIDAEGVEQETWTLKNAIITKLGFGDLDYGSEDLTEITMTFRYDWAQCTAGVSEFFDNK
tara:strand:- start:3457 stop:4011 length:555 start_codon:yes stop_codon:yes gene_type:complete